VALGWTCLVAALAAMVNVVGIHVVGSVAGWQRWLRVHEGWFITWRLALYSATAWAWWRMRTRLKLQASTAEARGRLRRAEVAAVFVVVLIEALRWLPSPAHA
jgi:hypothetical protein